MKTTQFEEAGRRPRRPAPPAGDLPAVSARVGEPAEMLTGSETEVAARIAEILAEKGLVK